VAPHFSSKSTIWRAVSPNSRSAVNEKAVCAFQRLLGRKIGVKRFLQFWQPLGGTRYGQFSGIESDFIPNDPSNFVLVQV
jgi:hypothetical protein